MKQYCKECGEFKLLDEFYLHPQGKNGVLSRCKECIKRGRKSDKEREMARKRDNEYYHTRSETRERCNRLGKEWRKNNQQKRGAHLIVSNYFKKKGIKKPNICTHCGDIKNIEMHHEDYNKPRELIVLCRKCHKSYHNGKIDIDKNKTFIIPF